MNKVFFQIADTDLTAFEDIQNHDVNSIEVYRTWTDGNWTDRKDVIRRRVEGTVTLGFARAADFNAFTALMNSERRSGAWYPVTVYVQNTGETAAIEAFVVPMGAAKWDIVNGRQWITQELTITER